MASPYLGASSTAYQLWARRHLRFIVLFLFLLAVIYHYFFGEGSSHYYANSLKGALRAPNGKDYASIPADGGRGSFEDDETGLPHWEKGAVEGRRLRREDRFTCDRCLSDPERCRIYGSRNVDLSRAFVGTGERIQRVLARAKEGHAIKTAVLGGSISVGQGCKCKPWHQLVFDWINEAFPHPDNDHSNGAVGARGSDYFKFCHHEHIDTESDIVFLEMSVNDFRMGDAAFENFETLLRSVLAYPSKPAVIILQTFKLDGIIATGGDSQLSLAEYYDVPVISARTWMLPMLMRDPDRLPLFFNYYMYEHGTDKMLERRDLLHPNANGHKSMADMIIIYLAQQICYLEQGRPVIPPSALDHVPQDDFDMDVLPRMRLNRQFAITGTEPELHPKCASLDTELSQLKPIAELTHGWELWTMPGFGGKKRFWRGQNPGDEIVFEMEIRSGQVTAYFLKSARWDLGSIECWLDDDRSRLAKLSGYWDASVTVGEFKTIFDGNIVPGRHLLHCKVLESTNNPDPKNHDFLFIGLFSV